MMKLTYRGITYDYNPPHVEMEPSTLGGKYRGLEWRFRNPKKNQVQQPSLNLMYRGVPYRTGTTEAAPQPQVVQPIMAQEAEKLSIQNLARTLMVGHHNNVKRRQQALLTRAFADPEWEVQTRHHWTPIQGKVPSQSWASYDRSRVATS